MHLKALFPISTLPELEKGLAKIRNLRRYAEEEGDLLEVEAVFMGKALLELLKDAKSSFRTDLLALEVDMAICKNAAGGLNLTGQDFGAGTRMVRAGVGEVIKQQALGFSIFPLA